MQVKLNVIAAAATALMAGAAWSQDMVVRIGHVAPVSAEPQTRSPHDVTMSRPAQSVIVSISVSTVSSVSRM